MKELTPLQKQRLQRAAERVRKADSLSAATREAECALWKDILDSGVPMLHIARASGVSDAAIRNRFKRGPGKPLR